MDRLLETLDTLQELKDEELLMVKDSVEDLLNGKGVIVVNNNIPVKFIENLNKYSKNLTVDELLDNWKNWGEGRLVAINDYIYENGEKGVEEIFLLKDGTVDTETYTEDQIVILKKGE